MKIFSIQDIGGLGGVGGLGIQGIRGLAKRARALVIAKVVKHLLLIDLRHSGIVPKRVMKLILPKVREALDLPDGAAGSSCPRIRDEEHRCWWAWYRESPRVIPEQVFEARYDGGGRKVVFVPKPGSEIFSSYEWIMLMTSPADEPGEPPMRLGMSLPDVLHLCGVDECRRAMVFAHQRALIDAKRLGSDLERVLRELDPHRRERAAQHFGHLLGAAAQLERQLVEVGELVPTGRSRNGRDGGPGRDGAEVVDLERYRVLRDLVLRHLEGAAEEGLPFGKPEHALVGSYASTVGGLEDREIVMTGAGDHWTLSDTLKQPRGEDGDVDFRSLPSPFDDRDAALEEGRRQLRLAQRNGGPSSDFQA